MRARLTWRLSSAVQQGVRVVDIGGELPFEWVILYYNILYYILLYCIVLQFSYIRLYYDIILIISYRVRETGKKEEL